MNVPDASIQMLKLSMENASANFPLRNLILLVNVQLALYQDANPVNLGISWNVLSALIQKQTFKKENVSVLLDLASMKMVYVLVVLLSAVINVFLRLLTGVKNA